MTIRKAFFAAVNRMWDDSHFAATVGKHNTDASVTYTVTGRADYLWITFPDQTTAIARNDAGVPQTEDLEIWVRKEYGPKGGPAPWVIEGRSAAGGLSTPTPTPADGVLPHLISSHSDATITAAANGDVLAHNGTAWVDETPITTSAGAGDAGKLVRTDAGGQVDATLINDADIDHGSIGGLADDDHTQYHNDTRGDARYVQKTGDTMTGDLLGTNIGLSGYQDFTEIATPADPAADTLRLWAEDEGGFSTLHFKDANSLDHEVGRDIIMTVRNNTGSTITKGQWVYINGSTGVFPTVALARADSASTMPAMGVVVADITTASFGQVMTMGDARNIDTSAFLDGDTLYISAATAGAVSTTRATGSNQDQRVGIVTKSSAGAGIIAVLIGGAFDPSTVQKLTNKTLDSTNISTLTAKNPPVDADSAVIVDSAASSVFKRVTYTNIKAFLKTYFDTLYVAVTGNQTVAGIKQFSDQTGFGTSGVTSDSRVDIQSAETGTGQYRTLLIQSVRTPSGHSSDVRRTAFMQNDHAGANNLTNSNLGGGLIAISTQVRNTGSGTVTKMSGFETLVQATSTGAVTEAFGTFTQIRASNASAVIATAYGFFMEAALRTGTITNLYGVYIDDATAENYFAGSLGIGLDTYGASILGIKAGDSTNDAAVGGVLYVTTTQTGNVGTGEDDLASYSVPANTLSANGMSLWFEAWGTVAANIATKNIRVRFGTSGTNLIATVAYNPSGGGTWYIRGRIIRTGAATQKGMVAANGNAYMSTSLNQTLSGAVTLKVTGEATTTNDILLESFIVGYDDQNT